MRDEDEHKLNINNMGLQINLVLDYRIIQGLPDTVEKEVKTLLEKNWQPYSEMLKMKAPCSSIDIVIQCMVLYR